MNNVTLSSVFKETAERLDDQVAISYEKENISYRELDQASDRLSLQLLRYRGKEVLILLPLSRDYHISIVAGMKAGCHIYPLDYTEQTGLIMEKVNRIKPSAILLHQADTSIYSLLCQQYDIELIEMSIMKSSDESAIFLGHKEDEYLHSIMTSGSSGTPKTISLERRSILFDALSTGELYGFESHQSLFHLSKPASSFHLNSLWRCLLRGCTFIASDLVNTNLESIWRQIIKSKPSKLQGQTSILLKLVKTNAQGKDIDTIRHLIIGGEPLQQVQLSQILSKFPKTEKVTYNYSSTETMLIASITLPPDEILKFDTIPVGFPAQEKIVTIENEDRQILGKGQVGQIVVTSNYLAKKIQGITSQDHLKIDVATGKITYQTGDLGYFHPNGYLVHLGRADQQIKINGVRIDLSLIMQTLLKTNFIEDVQVFPIKPTKQISEILVAAVVLKENQTMEDLQNQTAKNLPFSHIPKIWVPTNQIPLTSRGKVDIQALKEMATSQMQQEADKAESTAPQTPARAFLCREWMRILDIDHVDESESIFYQGAESIHIFEMIHLINDHWKLSLKPDFFVIYSSIINQSDAIAAHIGVNTPTLENTPPDKLRTLLGF